MEVRSFDAAAVEPAGRLLAARHAAHRRREQLLAPAFEDPALAEAEVRAAWGEEGASGAVVLDAGAVVGYLLGAPRDGATWGAGLWVGPAGCAVADAALLAPLYAHAGQQWVDRGRTAHYAVVPAGDRDQVDAWWRLGFGLQHVHAVREPENAPVSSGVRVGQRSDVPRLAELDLVLPAHLRRAPVLSAEQVPTLEQARLEWEQALDDERFTAFVAEHGGEVVGSAVLCPVELSSVHVGPARLSGAAFFAFAAVMPSARGLGIGGALGRAVLAEAYRRRAPAVVSDWRATNPQAARAWRSLGYRESFWRVHRLVGH